MTIDDAIVVLKRDHENLKGLLAQLTQAPDANRRLRLLGQIEVELKVHEHVEETIFYPAFKRAIESKSDRLMFFEAHEEHQLVDQVLEECREVDPSSEHFAAKAKVLQDLVEHHVQEEEGEMFVTSRDKIPLTRLKELGVQIKERKERLLRAAQPPRPPTRRPAPRPRASRARARHKGRKITRRT